MLDFIKQLFLDLSLLFKNFIHWNISKILIWILSFLLWVLLWLPILILMVIIWYFDPVNWQELLYNMTSQSTIPIQFYSELIANVWYVVLQWFLALVLITLFIIWISYKFILYSKLNLSYLSWKKLPYKENVYFDFALIKKFAWILGWGGLYLLIPIWVFILSFIILYFIFGWASILWSLWTWFNAFSIILLIIAILCILVFIYISFRITFSFVNLVDNQRFEELKTGKEYVKDSIWISKWTKVLKFISWALLFWLAMLPFVYIWWHIDYKFETVSLYIDYKSWYEVDLEESDIEFLDLMYWDLWVEEITSIYNNYRIYTILYMLFAFLIMSWLFEMFIVSMYKRVMIKDLDNKN